MRTTPPWVAVLLSVGMTLPAGAAYARRKPPVAAPTPPPVETPDPSMVGITEIEVKPLPPPSVVEDGRATTTSMFLSSGLPADVESEALSVVAEQLRRDNRIRYFDAAELLEPPEHTAAAIAAADRDLAAAQKAFAEMDLDTARPKIEAALTAYRRHLPALVASSGIAHVRDAWIRLAAIRFLDGNADGARDAMRHVLVYDSTVTYSKRTFPPQMKETVNQARTTVDMLGPGKLTVTSVPDGAAVYINGTIRGLTPLTINDASPGPSHVTVFRTGYMVGAADIEVPGGSDVATLDLKLHRFDSDPWEAVESVRDQLGQPDMPRPAVAATTRLHADLLILFSSEKTGAGRTLTGWLYDARPRTLIKKVVKSGSEQKTAATAKALAVELLRGVPLDGKGVRIAVPEEPEGPTFAERWGAFRESGAFWPVVGVVGGVVLAGAAVGIAGGAGAFGPPDNTQDVINAVILFGAQPRR